jgi:2,5-diamino-6-(ribosylamino)-4(3H)-pyrimidinone 5'-phosphate reductase
MLPKLIIHNLISLDGSIDSFEPYLDNYYEVAVSFGAEAILFGSNTIEKAIPEVPLETEFDFRKPNPRPDDKRPFWIIVDSRGRLRNLHLYRRSEYCRDIVVLVSETTPKSYLTDYLAKRNYSYIMAGEDHVDFRKALELLSERYGVKVIRTDSGGILNSILLEQGLVDEINLIISPVLVGKGHTNLFRSLNLSENNIKLKSYKCEALKGGQVLLAYRVLK